jgi:hypothetical protein
MEAIIVIKKNTHRNRVIETPVEAFLCHDIASFKCALWNESSRKDESFHLTEISFNDSEGVECYTTTDEELRLHDDNGNELELEVHTSIDEIEEPIHESGVYDTRKEVILDGVSISNTDIDHLKITDELKNDITNQAENIVSNMNDELDK